MRPAVQKAFERALAAFPAAVHLRLRQLPLQMGRLTGDDVDALCDAMNLPPRGLALALLPLAQAFSRAEISGFQVGAVALAEGAQGATDSRPKTPKTALFLGANLEFGGLPLHHTIHAEQAAALNAWHADALRLQALAVSSPPCGVCRQFLVEFDEYGELEILVPSIQGDPRSIRLSDLLPMPFGPADLKKRASLFDRRSLGWYEGGLSALVDPLVQTGKRAAIRAYAPYTENQAGCALALKGTIVSGRSLESAAYNPGLTALQAALALAALTGADLKSDIERIALVERPTKTSQSAAAKQFLSIWSPRVKLDSHYF
jgi:cytidine deaminase